MKRSSFLVILALCCAVAGAQESNTFVNLGFSADSRYFSFGTYGIGLDEYPVAELSTVDVVRNDFVPQGRKTSRGSSPVGIGQNGQATMYKLVAANATQLDKYRIDSENTGRLVYILLGGDPPKEDLNFTDFETGNEYKVSLVQKKDAIGASFCILLKVSPKNGASPRVHEIGLRDFIRPEVASYRISQIILGPRQASLIFVVEKVYSKAVQGMKSGFMVETLAIKP